MKTLLIGLGGTGAKIIEAVVHQAVSGNMPENIIPVHIDLDEKNANLDRIELLIKSYINLRNFGNGYYWGETNFFKPDITKLLKLKPVEKTDSPLAAAINYHSLNSDYQAAIDALFNRKQLGMDKSSDNKEGLGLGFKKRAHMGAALTFDCIKKTLADDSHLLKRYVNDLKDEPSQVVIVGSIFGGMGASGILNTGMVFRDEFRGNSNVRIKAIIMLPYFAISKESGENNKDILLVSSDSDMRASKLVLDLYVENKLFYESFDNIYLLGCNKPKDIVTRKAVSGGKGQNNPAHIFETIAATALNDKPQDVVNRMSIHGFGFNQKEDSKSEATERKKFERTEIGVASRSGMSIMRDFARLFLFASREDKSGWKKSQRCISWMSNNELNEFVNWAEFHNNWWLEITAESPDENHKKWEQFFFSDSICYDETTLCKKLSNKMPKKPKIVDLAHSLKEIEKIYQKKGEQE